MSGILALGSNTAGRHAECLRGVIQGWILAGCLPRSVGMTKLEAVRHSILPQAFRLAIPSWSNKLILTLQNLWSVFSVTLLDLMGAAKRTVSADFASTRVFLVLAAFYLAFAFINTRLLRMLERGVGIRGLAGGAKRRETATARAGYPS